jgi:hypothetical protein
MIKKLQRHPGYPERFSALANAALRGGALDKKKKN